MSRYGMGHHYVWFQLVNRHHWHSALELRVGQQKWDALPRMSCMDLVSGLIRPMTLTIHILLWTITLTHYEVVCVQGQQHWHIIGKCINVPRSRLTPRTNRHAGTHSAEQLAMLRNNRGTKWSLIIRGSNNRKIWCPVFTSSFSFASVLITTNSFEK